MNRMLARCLPVLLVATAACYPSHYRTVSGADKSELAKIRVHGSITIRSIDGEPLKTSSWAVMPQAWDDFFIGPGEYTLELSYYNAGPRQIVSSRSSRRLQVALKPGQILTLCPGVKVNRAGRLLEWHPYATEFPDFNPDRQWWLSRSVRRKVPPECK